MQTIKKQVLCVLSRQMTQKQLSHKLCVSKTTIKTTLWRLMQNGDICIVGKIGRENVYQNPYVPQYQKVTKHLKASKISNTFEVLKHIEICNLSKGVTI
jgi:transcription initiation factor IIE alpha subunit